MVRHNEVSGVDRGRTAITAALAAALLFGVSTPLAKILVGDLPPVLLAALLYLGSGLGLWTYRLIRVERSAMPPLSPREVRWLAAAVLAGGIVGPILLMYGLVSTSSSSASLLLNLESAFTGLLAWIIFREHTDARMVLGTTCIVVGGAALAWSGGHVNGGTVRGILFIAGACLCWAVDNNLTRMISAADADFIAGTKGLIAGVTNLVLAMALGAALPSPRIVAAAMVVGLLGYGVSLVLFVIALRGLGAARAGAYFSTAPFLGTAVAVLAFHAPMHGTVWAAALLMAAGVSLHLMERHSHPHSHPLLNHVHSHTHDAHHRHDHGFPWDGSEPHSHEHTHDELIHDHVHYPDLHHRHGHNREATLND